MNRNFSKAKWVRSTLVSGCRRRRSTCFLGHFQYVVENFSMISRLIGRSILRSPTPIGLHRYQSLSSYDIKQGGAIYLDLQAQNSYTIRVTTGWQDHTEVTFAGQSDGMNVIDSSVEQILEITDEHSQTDGDKIGIDVVTPQSINLFVRAHEMDLSVSNKLEGDVNISCKRGSVSLEKIRGMNVTIDVGHASLQSSKLIEGESVSINAYDFSGKMVNGAKIDISLLESMKVQAMYIEEHANIAVERNIDIGLFNGTGTIRSKQGNVNVRNIDGHFDISSGKGNVSLQVNKMDSSEIPNQATAHKGNLQVAIDPEIIAAVDCANTSTASRAIVTIVSDSFEEFSEMKPSFLETSKGSSSAPERSARRIQGRLTGQSSGTKRPPLDTANGASRSGKIDLDNVNQLNETMNLGRKTGSEDSFDLVLTAFGHIRMETLSWIEAIRRKHLGEDANVDNNKSVELGRTANSSQRVQDILNEKE
jgi:hypothetical protein